MAAELPEPYRTPGQKGPKPGKLGQAAASQFDIAASIGGVRGVIESVVPYTVFSLVYTVSKDLRLSIICALAPALVLVVWRLIARETVQQALSGVLVIALGAWLAHRTGDAVNFFLPNILKNLGFALLYAVSIVVRWPLVGVVVGPVTGELFAWRHDPRRLAAYQKATWLWVGLFAVRLAVQVPLYLAKNVAVLGTLNGLVLGLPLFGLAIWLTWLVLKPVPLALTPEQQAEAGEQPTAADHATGHPGAATEAAAAATDAAELP